MKEAMVSVTAGEISAIACRRKRAVLMKTRPKFLELPFTIYFYEMSGNLTHRPNIGYTAYRYDGRGAVVGECICNTIKTTDIPNIYHVSKKVLRMTAREMTEYLEGKTGHICFLSDVKMYDQPKPIEEFGLKTPPHSWCYVKERSRE
jgi:predicted transcriptional regulator